MGDEAGDIVEGIFPGRVQDAIGTKRDKTFFLRLKFRSSHESVTYLQVSITGSVAR
jgi:hypothetical protein